jgi:acyl-CoA synthetase (AMP-forming)/AMP-acid ligase II
MSSTWRTARSLDGTLARHVGFECGIIRRGSHISPEASDWSRIDAAACLTGLDGASGRGKLPEQLALVDDFPRTASGKVLKRALRERLADGG